MSFITLYYFITPTIFEVFFNFTEKMLQELLVEKKEVEDIKQYLKKPNIFVAPVRLGGGIKGKVLEAMAMGVPVVATTEAVSGIDYSVGDFALISDDTTVFADNIVRLYKDDILYQTLSNNSRNSLGDFKIDVIKSLYKKSYYKEDDIEYFSKPKIRELVGQKGSIIKRIIDCICLIHNESGFESFFPDRKSVV